ncbi:MAG: DNA (cytosine-5-)-methyltransferase [Cytophagales bacterium]
MSSSNRNKQLKYIDLFAGLGGFHIALKKLGFQCVFASEIKQNLADLYERNFGHKPKGDITNIPLEDIPEHDILCAGFPCQPFSKAGDQKGLKDERNGSLFDSIVKILGHHNPKYFILENVRNLETHNQGETWAYIQEKLEHQLRYTLQKKVLSPHQFGIPQHRERCFIVGARDGLDDFQWPQPTNHTIDLKEYLGEYPAHATPLEARKKHALNVWQEFLATLAKDIAVPSWPIWSMEFGATYPFEDKTPEYSSQIALGKTKGCFGIPLKGMSKAKKFAHLPSYAKRDQKEFPAWKKRYIRNNRAFYEQHKKILAPVVEKIKQLNVPSWQKFEWNVKGGTRNVCDYIIQFRGSGIRIKKRNFFPSLVTVSTQIPVIGWQNRYLTPKEGARIQSMPNIELPKNLGSCFSALGNAVNVYLVKKIASRLIKHQPAIIKLSKIKREPSRTKTSYHKAIQY